MCTTCLNINLVYDEWELHVMTAGVTGTAQLILLECKNA